MTDRHGLFAVVSTLALLATPALLAPPAAGETVRADDARVRAVTVYRDRAEVVRAVRLDLPAGASTVELHGLPEGLDADSVRVAARGVPAVLGAVEIVRAADEPEETPELAAAREEVERLEREQGALVAHDDVDRKLTEYLDALRAARAEDVAEGLGAGEGDAAGAVAIFELLAGRYAEIAERRLDRRRNLEELKEELEIARARLATLKPKGAIRSRTARVDVTAERAGALDLELAYVAPGASWRPAYRAELDAATGDVALTMEGVVRQSTGEDWNDIALSLSSASPLAGVEPPFLTPRVLRVETTADGSGAFAMRSGVHGEPVEFDQDAFVQNTMDLAPDVEATVSGAALEATAYTVAYAVPGRTDVPADGRDHRVRLADVELAGTLVHRVVPELDDRAYLTSVTTTPADRPILAGRVRVFAGGAHLGSYGQAELGPGVEWTLPFGVDNRLEVVRVRRPRSEGKQGLTGSKQSIDYLHRTQLANLQDRPVTVVLEERIPVAENERVEIELDTRATTGGFERSPRRAGVLIWTFELAPKEKREVELAYTVTYPDKLQVSGLPERP